MITRGLSPRAKRSWVDLFASCVEEIEVVDTEIVVPLSLSGDELEVMEGAQSSIGNADAGVISELASFTCSTSGETCVCREVFMNASQTLTGTYTTNGNQVTVVYTGFDAGTTPTESFDYCVSGDTLKLHSPGTGGSDIVLTYAR